MTAATITAKGRLTLPKDVRTALGVCPGDRVGFVRMEDGNYAVMPATHSVKKLNGLIPSRRSLSRSRIWTGRSRAGPRASDRSRRQCRAALPRPGRRGRGVSSKSPYLGPRQSEHYSAQRRRRNRTATAPLERRSRALGLVASALPPAVGAFTSLDGPSCPPARRLIGGNRSASSRSRCLLNIRGSTEHPPQLIIIVDSDCLAHRLEGRFRCQTLRSSYPR
jgi:antitoxin PrlF